LIGDIEQMGAFTRAVISGYALATNDIIAGRVKDRNDIERHLDHLLDYCYDDECHLMYSKILDESMHPGLVADYGAIYDDIWCDNTIEDDDSPI